MEEQEGSAQMRRYLFYLLRKALFIGVSEGWLKIYKREFAAKMLKPLVNRQIFAAKT